MSQEEEKLIEDVNKIFSLFNFSENNSLYNYENLRELIKEFVINVHRSGKLAGFEVCEQLIPKKKEEGLIRAGESGRLYWVYHILDETEKFYNDTIDKIKSLIEEERKKL